MNGEDKKIISKLNLLIKTATLGIDNYKFGIVAEKLYAFIWHDFADKYIESVKERIKNKDRVPLIILRHSLINILKLIHPFMPFVSESVWYEMEKQRKDAEKMLIDSSWPMVSE